MFIGWFIFQRQSQGRNVNARAKKMIINSFFIFFISFWWSLGMSEVCVCSTVTSVPFTKFIIAAYLVLREGNVFSCVCLSTGSSRIISSWDRDPLILLYHKIGLPSPTPLHHGKIPLCSPYLFGRRLVGLRLKDFRKNLLWIKKFSCDLIQSDQMTNVTKTLRTIFSLNRPDLLL